MCLWKEVGFHLRWGCQRLKWLFVDPRFKPESEDVERRATIRPPNIRKKSIEEKGVCDLKQEALDNFELKESEMRACCLALALEELFLMVVLMGLDDWAFR